MSQRSVRQLLSSTNIPVLPSSASARDAADIMATAHTGAVLIVSDGALDGIFTERDAATRVMAEGLDSTQTRLEDVMTRRVLTVHPEDSVQYALRLMRDVGFRHLPVVADGEIVGLLSVSELLHAPEFAAVPHWSRPSLSEDEAA